MYLYPETLRRIRQIFKIKLTFGPVFAFHLKKYWSWTSGPELNYAKI